MTSNYLDRIKTSFEQCSDWVMQALPSDKKVILNLEAEDTLFVRYNGHRVRQNTQVEQAFMKLQIFENLKSFKTNFTLTGDLDMDLKNTKVLFHKSIMGMDRILEETAVREISKNFTSKNIFEGKYSTEEILSEITDNTKHLDFTGIAHFGPVLNMVRNSEGVKHEFLTDFFTLDYSLFNHQHAVKGMYCNSEWDQAEFENSLHKSSYYLELMQRKPVDVKPGSYRVYLAPGAVSELASMLSWGALSQKAYKTGRNPFQKLVDQEKMFSPKINVKENFGLGLCPAFNNFGEVAPLELELIKEGKIVNLLTSTKTANDYNLTSNYAEEDEYLKSLEISPGNLDLSAVLKELGTGLFLSNLHYLNWSDPTEARVTGMTRYACFWVENGEIVGPIKDLRFDESFYTLWGSELESITHASEIEPQTTTYYQRHLGGKKIPGMIINKMKFTL
jgi:predicted Zn-dependent protease